MLQEYIIGDGIGDVGYPLLPWLIVPCARGIDKQKDDFNYKLSNTRMCGKIFRQVERNLANSKQSFMEASHRATWTDDICMLCSP